MCGIAGVFASESGCARTVLPAMVGAQVHRGPDDMGEWHLDTPGGALGLGHRRLSILDLSPLGHQPMVDAESGDVIVYNGEIYNFRELRSDLEREGCAFRSDSDTEVLLRALARWGTETLARLRGMYAFAWYRPRHQTVVLARDPVGIKPLYYAAVPGAILFASEVRAILATGLVSRAVSPRGVAGMLAYGAVQEPFTFFRDIHPLPSGHLAEISLRAPAGSAPVRSRPFWSYPAPDPSISEREALEKLRTILNDSVRDHLIADVPVGVFLSSGIDSTIVAGLAARHAPGIEAFTVAFGDNADMSEGPAASRTAARFGIRHHDVQITNEASLDAAHPWLSSQDQPSMDGLNVYLVSKAVRERGIKVALSGQGGDEIFGGYPSFAEVPPIMRAMRKMSALPPAIRAAVGGVVAARRSRASREKFMDMLRTNGSAMQLTLARRRVLTNRHLALLGLDAESLGLDPSFQHPETLARLPVSDHYPIHSISLAETDFYMGNMLLRDCDANGMAHSLEIRVPVLDQRVIDTFLSVPGKVRLPRGGCDKHLLRAGFPELFSPEILNQNKVGFILPIKRWMAGPMREMCVESLGYLKRADIVAPEGVDLVWSAFLRDPESVMWSRAWTLVVLGAYAVSTEAQADTTPAHQPPVRIGRRRVFAHEAAMVGA